MTDDDFERLEFIFYNEAPYDYVLEIVDKPRKYFRGSCSYDYQVCFIYGPEDYTSALITMLHEIAHARIQAPYAMARGHTEKWEQEFIFLLDKHKVNKDTIRSNVTLTPTMMRFTS